MLSAFHEEAEVEYENHSGSQETKEYQKLEISLAIARARWALAQELNFALELELKDRKSELVIASEAVSEVRLCPEKVSFWASMRYGISIPEWAEASPIPAATITNSEQCATGPVQHPWERITIKILATKGLSWSVDNIHQGTKSFAELQLIDKRTQRQNWPALILIALTKGNKFPTTTKPKAKDSTIMSKVRTILKEFTAIESDPFYSFNDGDGWRPRFKLIDARRDSSDRAKKKATHTTLTDNELEEPAAPDFGDQSDEAGEYIREYGR